MQTGAKPACAGKLGEKIQKAYLHTIGMSEHQPTYISRVRIVRDRGPIRRAFLPVEPEPVFFGTHDEVREHYGTAPGQYPDHATTLDYVVAAAAG
jgi:hypothetical protein